MRHSSVFFILQHLDLDFATLVIMVAIEDHIYAGPRGEVIVGTVPVQDPVFISRKDVVYEPDF